jgi:hypothetical protein
MSEMAGRHVSKAYPGMDLRGLRLPSRRIPPACHARLGFPGCLLLAGLASSFTFLIYSAPPLARWVIAVSVCLLYVVGAVLNKREKRRLQALADARKGESICAFARSFNPRDTDTWVIRAAYQAIQQWLPACVDAFPIRASDTLLGDLRIDAEDVEDLILDIARRSGHSIEKPEDNPYHGSVLTVRDLVLFIDAQPRYER